MVTACLPTLPLQMVLAQQTAALGDESGTTTRSYHPIGDILDFCFVGVGGVARHDFSEADCSALGIDGHGGAVDYDVDDSYFAVVADVWRRAAGTAGFSLDWLEPMSVGIARLAIAALLVLAFAGGATSMMAGALIGMMLGLTIAVWRTRDLWSLPSERFDRRGLLRQVIPLMLGFWACQFMFTADTIIAKAFFTDAEMSPTFRRARFRELCFGWCYRLPQ